jgi:hypothetical protein
MDVRGSSLREVLRNGLGSRLVLGIAIALVLPACADLVGLEDSVTKPLNPTGSPKPASELPPDETLPPPPPTNCGDRSSDPNNCGWCEHSCGQGSTCGKGFCSQTVIVQKPTIQAFVTDGDSLWMIENKSPVRCRADGPVTQVCDPIVRAEDVDARLTSLDIEIGFPRPGSGGNGNGGNGGNGSGGGGHLLGSKPLDARAIAREKNHIVITDEAYHAVLACPLTGSCSAQNLAIIDVRGEEWEDTKPFGRALASGPTLPSSLSWSQGNGLFAESLPADGKTIRTSLSRTNDAAVTQIERILAPAGIFWISSTGLHHAPSVTDTPQRWSPRVLTDLSVDENSVYVAGKEGLFRLARTNRAETVAAKGEFMRVAADAQGLYATMRKPDGRTAIVGARQGQLLEVAVVDGAIDSLAVVGKHVYFQTQGGNGHEIRRVAR